MNCPHCKVALMGGMTVCPKCKYDTKTADGGKRHGEWLADNGEPIPETLLKAYPELQTQKEDKIRKIEEAENQKKQIEANKSTMMLSTCPSMEGYKIKKQLGLVFGECLFKSGFLKSLSASFENIGAVLSFGDKELSCTTALLDNAREYAIRKMIDKAANLGANAIVGIDSESSAGGDIIHIAIMGTAVYLEPLEE